MNGMNSDKSSNEPRHFQSAVPGFVYHFCRIVAGLIFVVASCEKLVRPWDFGIAVYVYKILVGPFAYFISPLAIIMPFLELVTGLCLLISRWVRPAAILILAMNIVFIIAIASVMVRGMDIDCGCGLDVGIIAQIAGTQADIGALVRDFVIVAMSVVVLFAPQSRIRSRR
jgi:uncharacterized membrane protein YphA (DoxX/SURF4 family)